jgi:hypothetical protein
MKTRTSILAAIALFILAGSAFAEEKSMEFMFPAIPVEQLIKIYQGNSGQKTLTISTEAQKNWAKTVSIKSGPMTKSEALKLIRKAMAEQTGIILTDFDNKLSVTYNDQFATEFVLPVQKNKAAKSKP